MSKQVLSVADFATMLNLINEVLENIERWELKNARYYFEGDAETITLETKEVKEKLKNHKMYQDLLHLKKSLQSLNIEVETPDVEVAD